MFKQSLKIIQAIIYEPKFQSELFYLMTLILIANLSFTIFIDFSINCSEQTLLIFFLKKIDLISLRIWILRPKLGRHLFFSIILGRWKTKNAIFWNTLIHCTCYITYAYKEIFHIILAIYPRRVLCGFNRPQIIFRSSSNLKVKLVRPNFSSSRNFRLKGPILLEQKFSSKLWYHTGKSLRSTA